MQTKSYAYNEATRDLAKYKTAVTFKELKAFCEADPQSNNCPQLDTYNAHCPEFDLSLPYNAQVVDATIEKLQLEKNERTEKIISGLVYNTRSYNRAKQTISNYQNMLAGNYIPVQDITPEHHDKKAQLVGESHGIMGSTKIDLKVTLVYIDDNNIGYKKPRQRTRYYVPAFDSQLFIRVIE